VARLSGAKRQRVRPLNLVVRPHMDEAWTHQLETWREFYLLVGTAGVTLTGLLFVRRCPGPLARGGHSERMGHGYLGLEKGAQIVHPDHALEPGGARTLWSLIFLQRAAV
jgi:hypothetical protein